MLPQNRPTESSNPTAILCPLYCCSFSLVRTLRSSNSIESQAVQATARTPVRDHRRSRSSFRVALEVQVYNLVQTPVLEVVACHGGGLNNVSLYNGSNPVRPTAVLPKASLINAIWQNVGIPVDELCWLHIQIFQTSVLAASFTWKSFEIH